MSRNGRSPIHLPGDNSRLPLDRQGPTLQEVAAVVMRQQQELMAQAQIQDTLLHLIAGLVNALEEVAEAAHPTRRVVLPLGVENEVVRRAVAAAREAQEVIKRTKHLPPDVAQQAREVEAFAIRLMSRVAHDANKPLPPLEPGQRGTK